MSTIKWLSEHIDWGMTFSQPVMGITTKSKSLSRDSIKLISLGVLAYKNNKMKGFKGNVVM